MVKRLPTSGYCNDKRSSSDAEGFRLRLRVLETLNKGLVFLFWRPSGEVVRQMVVAPPATATSGCQDMS
jgi:hypothetical protein